MRGIVVGRCLLAALALGLLSPSVVAARFTWGGWLSRTFAIGTSPGEDGSPVETLYVVAREDGDLGTSPGSDKITLWAFCTDATCENVPESERHQEDGICEKPCKWRFETESLQNEKIGAPIVVPKKDAPGHWIVFGTNDGEVYRFDYTGKNGPGPNDWGYDWLYGPDDNSVDKGFYARVAHLELQMHGEQERRDVVFAISWGGSGTNVQSHLHAIDLATGQSISPAYPYKVSLDGFDGFQSLFDLVADDNADGGYAGGPRVYVGFEKGSTNYLRAVTVQPGDTCAGAPAPCVAWRVDPVDGGGARLGGVVLEDVEFPALVTPPAEIPRGDVLFANLQDGTTAIHLDDNPPLWSAGQRIWTADILQTYRSLPAESRTSRELTGRAVYVGKRGGDQGCGGEGRIYRLDPATGEGDGSPIFPACAGTKIGTVSFSSPVVSPRSGHIFFGGAHGGDPIWKVDPAHPQHSHEAGGAPSPPVAPHFYEPSFAGLRDYSKVGWLAYAPEDGWRTSAILSRDATMLHIGSAKGIVYGMEADAPCGLVRWCYDTRTGDGGDCRGTANADGTCTGAAPAACCTALRDDSVDEPCHRTAPTCKVCWDASNQPTTCYPLQVVKPTIDDGNTIPINEEDYSSVVVDYASIDEQWIDDNDPRKVTFSLWFVPPDAIGGSRAEYLNESNDEYGAFAPTIFGFVRTITLAAGDNEIRFAGFDSFGNESPFRLRITNVP
jgi:hypothetical protein